MTLETIILGGNYNVVLFLQNKLLLINTCVQ